MSGEICSSSSVKLWSADLEVIQLTKANMEPFYLLMEVTFIVFFLQIMRKNCNISRHRSLFYILSTNFQLAWELRYFKITLMMEKIHIILRTYF